jgi:hypothetical protein
MLKRNTFSVHSGTSTHVLDISGQPFAMLAPRIYLGLRAFTVPPEVRAPATLVLIWLYILVATNWERTADPPGESPAYSRRAVFCEVLAFKIC